MTDLDSIELRWDDFERTGEFTRSLLREIAGDKDRLRRLVFSIADDESRFSLCEKHLLFDYIVLLDRPTFRLRLHMAYDAKPDVPHDHRHSFSSMILNGAYQHSVYSINKEIYGGNDDERARQWMAEGHADDPFADVEESDFELLVTRLESPGDSYTLHHGAVHTTLFEPGTVSLFIRGPNVKTRSFVMEQGRLWWRFGKKDEPQNARESQRMSETDFRAFVSDLEKRGVI